MNVTTTTNRAQARVSLALALAAAAATPALATTYTWLANPAADSWTKANVNWNDGSSDTGAA